MSRHIFNPEARKKIIITFVCAVVLIYFIQLFTLQVLNPDYKTFAENNAFLNKTIYPARGLMYDRNDNLLVYNQPAYDVMVVFKETQPFDTLAFCRILKITPEYYNKRVKDIRNRNLNPGYSPYTPQVFITQLGFQEYGQLQESLYRFPGFYIQHRTVREFKYPNAAHVLGYIAEADKDNISKDNYYTKGDYIGKTGIELSYEKILRGEKGIEVLLRDSRGRIKGKYEDGAHDKDPVSGKNLKLSIDIDLQAYGEELMRNKLGSIVMIEPSTGEILCMVSSPAYDPSTLIGRDFVKGYQVLAKDPYKPLLNRSISGMYPPGSTFKPTQGLIFLEEEVIQPYTPFACYGGYPPLGGRPKCHPHGSPLSLAPAIATSCNAYFCWGLRYMLDSRSRFSSAGEALTVWKDYMVKQGYGYKLGVDLPGEKRGFIPNKETYNKVYSGRWNSSTIISIAIGQGEITSTPLQICNLAATIANRGYFYTPHTVRSIDDGNVTLDSIYTKPKYTGIKKKHYETIVEGMALAVTGGTCRGIWLPDIEVCGKTGTAQNPMGKDHSAFMGFAPKENPQVAIAVYVENGGFGATFAVPIARLMIQKYLKKEVPESDKWIEDNMKNAIILRNALQKD